MSFDFLIYLFIFVFGTICGSFLNCVIYRLEIGESFLKGRSYCPHCKHVLTWQDLIPIFSFLILKGKCRYCHQKISWQYPLVELATGILFVSTLIYFFSKTSILVNSAMTELTSIYYLVIACFLIIIFVYDLKHYIIPDKVIYPAIAIAFLYQLFKIWDLGFVPNFEFRISNFQTLANPLLSAFLASLFFLMIVLISQGKWMGVGDIKLAFLMGLILSFPNILVALFLAFFIGAIIGIGLIIARKKTLKSEIPFGPFLVSGTFLALFLGQRILGWYLNLFSPR